MPIPSTGRWDKHNRAPQQPRGTRTRRHSHDRNDGQGWPIIMILSLVPLFFSACSIKPKWNRYMDKENPTLEAFAPAVIKKNSAETDPRYQEHSYYYKADANGVPAADATFWLTIDRQNHYQARAEFSVVSPWAAIINAFGRQQVKGDIVNGKFRPTELKGLFVVRDKTIEVTVRYPKNGGQPKTTMNPPRNLATITPIDQQLLAQSYDITSALLTLMNRFQKNGQAAA
ncbi:MAG: hypothetical protein ORN57_05240, partial [Alphaproteobacteria bacterium]|nr:hypothetical protein [Alphaproteobacteria bacterium]